MKILIWLLLFLSVDCCGMYWAKGGRKTAKQLKKTQVVLNEKTATEQLQEFINERQFSDVAIITVEELIDQGANPNIKTDKGIPLLQKVIFWLRNSYPDNQQRMMLKLIAKGIDIHATDQYGNTALMTAIIWNLQRTAKILLEFGADPTTKNSLNKTALDLAKEAQNKAIIELLMATPRKHRIP